MRRAISSRDGSASHHPAATTAYKHGTRKRFGAPVRHFTPRALTKDHLLSVQGDRIVSLPYGGRGPRDRTVQRPGALPGALATRNPWRAPPVATVSEVRSGSATLRRMQPSGNRKG